MSPTETTALLVAARNGDSASADRLLPHVYDELRRLSASRIEREPGAVTISATGLVHEAYLKLVGSAEWTDRAHFLAIAARAMRQVLTDRARARGALKRGGPERSVTLHESLAELGTGLHERILDLDEALHRLTARNEDLARVVELRFFGGLEVQEISAITGASERTVARQWARAKAHLRADLG